MSHLVSLFQLVQLTRAQVQYGYLLSGVPKEKLSDLAQHHYLVTFIAWQLTLACNQAGAKLDILKVLEISLIHDLGELFGGDINWFYARINPDARKLAKSFEAENNKLLAQAFGAQKDYFFTLQLAAHANNCDEAKIAKLADYMECLQYKSFIDSIDTEYDQKDAMKALHSMTRKIQDKCAKLYLIDLLKDWCENIQKPKKFLAILAEEFS